MAKSSEKSVYARFLKNWPKLAGPQPTQAEFDAAEKLGLRPGGKATTAMALYLRKDGATTGQVSMIVGGPQLNVRRTKITAKQVVDVPMGTTAAGHKVYKVALATAKAKPVSKKRVSKKPAQTPAVEIKDVAVELPSVQPAMQH